MKPSFTELRKRMKSEKWVYVDNLCFAEKGRKKWRKIGEKLEVKGMFED